MLLKIVNAAALTALCCGVACSAEEPTVPPPPAAEAQTTPGQSTSSEPAVPIAPVPDIHPSGQPLGQPCGTWQHDYGNDGYRPEAVVPGTNAGLHLRYPYYSYRRPWYPAGPASVNVTIIW